MEGKIRGGMRKPGKTKQVSEEKPTTSQAQQRR